MSENQVDAALAAPIVDRVARIAALPEDQWFDRKSIRTEPKGLARPLVAFANAEGGTIIVGIHGGVGEGVKAQPSRINAIRQAAVDFTVPPVRMSVDQVGIVRADGQADSVLVIRVPPSEGVHETVGGDCYLRIGDESRRLSASARMELAYDRGASVYDGTKVAGASVRDLDRSAIAGYRVAANAQSTNQRLLQARSLLTRDGDLTVAAWLLFADMPQSTMPHAHVRVIEYASVDRGSGVRHQVIAGHDVRVEGRIPDVISRAFGLVDQWMPKREALGADGRFEPVPLLPRDAWREAIVNAVIHRSYSMVGDHIRVEIFPDRIEVESPGRFPGLIDPRNLEAIARYARNPRIARVCADLRIGRELGEGIRRMMEDMRLAGLADPIYEQRQASVRVTLAAASRVPEAIARRLPRRAEDVLAVLARVRRPMGTGEIQDMLGWSRPTVAKHLQALRAERLVVWRGRSDNDPRATWEIAY